VVRVLLSCVFTSIFVVNFVEIAFAGMQPMTSPPRGTILDAPVSKVPASKLAQCSDILVDGEMFSGSSYILLKDRGQELVGELNSCIILGRLNESSSDCADRSRS
jgi:hypothetical protein